jgi:hypothetical protein
LVRRARSVTLVLAAALLGAYGEGSAADPEPAPVAAGIAQAPAAVAPDGPTQPATAAPEITEPSLPEPKPVPPFDILGGLVEPGEKRQLALPIADEVGGSGAPITVAHGLQAGPVLCVAGGIHGDELNGVEVARNLLHAADPAALRGTLVVMPIVNLYGFKRGSRYLADRRDLNRFFPGRPRGSLASRIAHAMFSGVVRRCSALVDLHSGSFHRTNLPQVRANLNDPATLDLAMAFGPSIVVHNPGLPGTLRRAAGEHGIPAITYEAGEPMRFQREEIERGVLGLQRVLVHIGMLEPQAEPEQAAAGETSPPAVQPAEITDPTQLYWSSRWVRVDAGGILLARVRLGDQVAEGELLGTVTDPLSNQSSEIYAPRDGRVIGMALDQIVVPGFAAFHVASPARAGESAESGGLEPKDFETPPVELGPDSGEE